MQLRSKLLEPHAATISSTMQEPELRMMLEAGAGSLEVRVVALHHLEVARRSISTADFSISMSAEFNRIKTGIFCPISSLLNSFNSPA